MIEVCYPFYSVAMQFGITEEQLQNLVSAYREEIMLEPMSFGDLLEVLE